MRGPRSRLYSAQYDVLPASLNESQTPNSTGLAGSENFHMRSFSAGLRPCLALRVEARLASDAVRHLPDQSPLRRQLVVEEVRFGGRILDVTGRIFEIDAVPWTPRFWGELLRTLGLTPLDAKDLEKERLTIRSQAFQFMTLVENDGQSLQRQL